jgi:hypothetical protein
MEPGPGTVVIKSSFAVLFAGAARQAMSTWGDAAATPSFRSWIVGR